MLQLAKIYIIILVLILAIFLNKTFQLSSFLIFLINQ